MDSPLERLPAEALQILRALHSAPDRAATFGTLRAWLVCERDGWYQRFRRGMAPLVRYGLVEEQEKRGKGPAPRYILTAEGFRLAAAAQSSLDDVRSRSAPRPPLPAS